MRAAYYTEFGGPEVLQVGDLPAPVVAPGHVLIDIAAASLIPGDWKLRAGHLKDLFPVTFPKVPGRDGAGTVRAVGAGVTGFAPGDPVCFVSVHTEQGTCAEQICRPAGDVVAMPPGLSFAEAAALMHAGVCAWICLADTAKVGKGDRVLVHGGAGAIGGAAVQIGAHLGAEVTTTCRSSNTDYVRDLGAHHVVAYDQVNFWEEGREYDVVVDLIGGEVHRRSYDVLRPGGTLVYLLAAAIEDLSDKYGVTTVLAPIREERAIHETVARLARDGVLRPQVSDILPLDAVSAAHRRLEAGEVSRGRLVFDIAGAHRKPS